MIDEPLILIMDSFQQAWIEVVNRLAQSKWESHNLVVQIKNPNIFDNHIHEKISDFAESQGLLGPKHVAYTIFPQKLYQRKRNAEELFNSYNKHDGLYEKLQRRTHRWGTYFRRMTNYEGDGKPINQLGNIITAIRSRRNCSKAAYTIIIQNPGGETIQPLGGPCLNYIAVQIERKQENHEMIIGLLAVYRNHDFLERAYGNYWGLCNLLIFLASEVGGIAGPLTCISSHAYITGKINPIRIFLREF